MGTNAEAEFLRVDEVSDDWNRCCCAPYHPLRLEVRQYIPMPDDATSTDYSNYSQDFRDDWSRMNARDKQAAMRKLYMNNPVLLSMVRDDGMRCCYKCPCKWYSTFVCFDCCRDGMHIYSGSVHDEEKKEVGRPYNLDPHKLIGSVNQPQYAGWCTPTLHLRANELDSEEPFGKLEGPCFFGGWSEMCCQFRFFASRFNSKKKEGDLAIVIKKKPKSLAMAFVELVSDADVYGIEFKEDAKLTAQQKVTVLSAQLLADYMFFDGMKILVMIYNLHQSYFMFNLNLSLTITGNTDKCGQDENFVYCYICYYSLVGKICPCYIAIPKGGN